MNATVILACLLAVALLVLGALFLIGWAYNLGMRDGRKAEKGDVMRRIMTPEFTQDLVREVHAAERRENLRRYGTPSPNLQ